MTRAYYRCEDCLTIAAAEAVAELNCQCGLCGGRVECMGLVRGERLVKSALECPCDGRCTSARGPNCDCHCGGKNHGSGLLVRVVRDVGPVPRFLMPPSRKAAAIAAEWRRGYAAVLAAIAEYERRKRDGERIGGDRPAYEALRHYMQLWEAKTRLRCSRCHKSRMKLIYKLLPEFEPAQAATAQAYLF